MLAATSHSAEVSKLKQSLERVEEQLGSVGGRSKQRSLLIHMGTYG